MSLLPNRINLVFGEQAQLSMQTALNETQQIVRSWIYDFDPYYSG